MSVNQYGFVFRLIGFALMLLALTRLKKYNKAFDYTLIACGLMGLTSLLLALAGIGDILYDLLIIDQKILEGSRDIISGVDMVAELIFHGALAWGIRAIAKETEEEKIAFAAVRNLVFLCVYYVLYGIALLPFDFTVDYVKSFSMPVVLLYFACIVLNLIMLFKCYVRICDEADVDMARKPSRFEFINRLRAESDRREEKAQRTMREYKESKMKRRK